MFDATLLFLLKDSRVLHRPVEITGQNRHPTYVSKHHHVVHGRYRNCRLEGLTRSLRSKIPHTRLVSYNCEEYHEIEKCHSAISSLWRFSLYTEKTQERRTRVKLNREKDHDEQIAIDATSLGPVGGFHEWAG